ncbi:halovibrin HvnC [Pseudomonas sp. HMWF021]|uniref:halovibrin HvnC n=1 Tax=Pseudomonas sp. HMWF021 TaxID=2056857 RepID=UPI000D389116|nr:halovibrin HvnC [Pseudomonas sp. HMWF021]PTT31983.1 halovibrin HvnC [Pseudomonas sp. HMWF021]
MRKLALSLLVMLLWGCSKSVLQPVQEMGVNNAQPLNGPAIAAQLNTLYARQFPNCNKMDSRPAFLCSGVMLRVTFRDPAGQYKVWDPSPASLKNGGVSFSYLRQDANFGRLAWSYGNGYIVYPLLEQPAGKLQLKVLCSYPMDAWGYYRSATAVCVSYPQYPNISGHCQDAGVFTAEQFKAAWDYSHENKNLRQCDFDVRDERNHLAGPAFYQSLRAKTLLGATGFGEHNEILIRTWAAGSANVLPIMAFFFITGGTDQALADAQYNQRDFYNSTNPKIVIPIIRLTLATSANGTATFTYVTTDQVVSP